MFRFKVPFRKAPADLTLDARHLDFDFEAALKANPYWCDNDPVISHFFNALQSTFPSGERFFIDSVRDTVEYLGEESLDEHFMTDIKGFVRQEGHHNKAHADWNAALIALGYTKVAKYDESLNKMRLFARKHLSVIIRITNTSAVEHYTAALAYLFAYKRPDLLEKAQSPFKEMFANHVLEELEHKAVCYDLFYLASGNYLRRLASVIGTALFLMFIVRRRHIYMLKKDKLWNWKSRKAALSLIWGRKGLIISSLPYVLKYLKPSFHPWDDDEREDYLKQFGHLITEAK